MSIKESQIPDVFVKWFRGSYDPENSKEGRKNFERIGYLVACNGGAFEVKTCGTVVMDDGPFKGGLTQEEGLELMQLSSFINGANIIDNNIFPYAMNVVQEWIEKTIKEHGEDK